MKLATPSHLRKITGEVSVDAQYKKLRDQLGVRPMIANGSIRIYMEVIAQAMAGGPDVRIKPTMNMGAFNRGEET